MSVMQFPDAARIHRMFASAEHRAAFPDRQRAFQALQTFLSDPV